MTSRRSRRRPRARAAGRPDRSWWRSRASSRCPRTRPAAGRRRRTPPAGAHQQVHHRRLRRVRPHAQPRDLAEQRRDRLRVGEVRRHPRQPLAQPLQRRGGVGPEREQRPAEPVPPLPDLRHDVRRAGDAAAGERPEALVERHVDGVEQRCHLGRRPAVPGRGLPQPGAVEMHRRTAVPRRRHLRDQLLPRWLFTAEVALRQLEDHGGDRLRHVGDVRHADQSVRVTDGPAGQPVQPLVATPFVPVKVAGRVEEHRTTAAPVGVHPQRRRLRHGAAGQEDGGRGAEHRGGLLLELGDDAADAVPVDGGVGGDAREQPRRRLRTVPGQPAGAAGAELVQGRLGRHGRHSARLRRRPGSTLPETAAVGWTG